LNNITPPRCLDRLELFDATRWVPVTTFDAALFASARIAVCVVDGSAFAQVWAAMTEIRRHPLHMAQLDMPASPAVAAQQVHFEEVVLDDGLEVFRAAHRTLQ